MSFERVGYKATFFTNKKFKFKLVWFKQTSIIIFFNAHKKALKNSPLEGVFAHIFHAEALLVLLIDDRYYGDAL